MLKNAFFLYCRIPGDDDGLDKLGSPLSCFRHKREEGKNRTNSTRTVTRMQTAQTEKEYCTCDAAILIVVSCCRYVWKEEKK